MSIKIKVLLVDDHHAVRSGLRRLLEMSEDIEVIAEASSGEQACAMHSKFATSVIVMDLSMPGIGGLEALRRILISTPNTKVVMFSMQENAIFASQALSLGARGYVAKSCFADDLLQAVRDAFAGLTYVSPHIAQKIAFQADSVDQNPVQKLSVREFEVFRMLAEGQDVKEIADIFSISHKTVANYQTILKQKLGISNAVELVKIAIQYGVIADPIGERIA